MYLDLMYIGKIFQWYWFQTTCPYISSYRTM